LDAVAFVVPLNAAGAIAQGEWPDQELRRTRDDDAERGTTPLPLRRGGSRPWAVPAAIPRGGVPTIRWS
jgi:hypothetical protein